MKQERGRARKRACLLALAYLGLTFVFTYPLPFELATHHAGEAGGDAKIYLWSYWWTRTALEEGVSPFATDVIFHPIGIGLSFHTLAFLQGLLFAPLSVLAGKVAAANLIVLWTFPASALATYALARSTGSGVAGSFLAGTAFAFCPYRLARLAGHYDLLGTEWIPLYALAWTMLAKRDLRSVPLILAAGATAAAAGYTSTTYLVFLVFFTALLLLFRPRLFPRALATGLLAAALLFPWLRQAYLDRSAWTYERYPGADRYVADLTGYLTGATFDRNVTESTVFTGYLVLASAIAALVLWKRIAGTRFWLASASVFFVLSLGPTLQVGGMDTGFPLPFALLSEAPLLEELRAPSRFSVMTVFSLAVVLGLVWTHLMGLVAGRRWGKVFTAAASGLLVLEYAKLPAPTFPAGAAPVYRALADAGNEGAVVEVPGIEQVPVETMYHQTFHGKPILIGTAARVPREKSEYYFGLPLVRPLIDLRKGRIDPTAELVARDRESAPRVARFLDVGYFVVDRAYEKRGIVSYLEGVLPLNRWYEDENVIVFETRKEELPPDPRILRAEAPESRQHFESGFQVPEREGDMGFRWADRERSTILFRRPEGASRAVLELSPLAGLPLRVEGRLDERDLGAMNLASGWQEITFTLPPVKRRGAVERLWLWWSARKAASPTDPRVVAARVRAVRFE
jgi:hypothetical protein